jgi:tripartite-type tricarboxylate transporter receptor subunit TctC
MITTLRQLAHASISVVLLAVCSFAHGQGAAAYPTRSVLLTVPYGAGGATDTGARLLAQRLEVLLGQPVIVENRTGAAGIVASDYVAKAAPDGYTLIWHTSSSAAIVPQLYKTLSYDPTKAFKPVSLVAHSPTVMVIHKDVPAKNLAEFIAHLKANPGKLTYASDGVGSILHIQAELFQRLTGTKLVHVTYKSFTDGKRDLAAGRIAMAFDNVPGELALIKAGTVKPLGVSSGERVGIIPDVPAIAEAGLPTFKNGSWYSIFTPAGVPDAIAKTLERAAIQATNDLRQKLIDQGTIPVGSTSEELDKFHKSQLTYWRDALEQLNLYKTRTQ